MPIYKPSELHKLGFKVKKTFSQNFLIDQNILKKILSFLDIHPEDTILEIGPGPGALTEILLQNNFSIIAIEKDPEMACSLKRLQTKSARLVVYCADALTFPIEEILKQFSHVKVVANLPYHITTPLITKLIAYYPKIHSMTVMVQKEVGKKMTAQKNTSDYCSFTLFLQSLAKINYCFTVKPTSFYPSPSVHSSLIHMQLHPFSFSFPSHLFFTFVRKVFHQKRKMLRSSLKQYSSHKVEKILVQIGHTEKTRPQELSLDEFALLFSSLHPEYVGNP